MNESAIAYFTGQAERNYIVLGRTGEQTAQVATHEYVHLLVDHWGIEWPLWLNEGMADFYSTLKVTGNNTEFGDVIPGRLIPLTQDKWVPLSTIFRVDHDSPYYNEKNKASNFYNESWALVHMLATRPSYSKGFNQLLKLLAQETSSAEALERTYGKSVDAIETELRAYVRGNSFLKLVLRTGDESSKLNDPSQDANPFDVRLALADLLNNPGKLAERKARLQALVQEFPTRSEAHASMGYLELREGNRVRSVDHFVKAFALGSRSPKLLWDFALLGRDSHTVEAQAALTELIKMQPDNVEARIELAIFHAQAQRWTQAVTALREIRKVTSDLAPRLFSVKAQAELQSGLRREARESAENLRKYAETDEDRNTARRLIEYLDRVDAQEQVRPNTATLP